MFRSGEVVAAFKLTGTPTAADVIRYEGTRPLQFAPGAKSVYSNFGYCLLGRVIERVTGRAYTAYVQDRVLAPVGVTGVRLGCTLPADRDPREPWYSDPHRGPDVMHPGGGATGAGCVLISTVMAEPSSVWLVNVPETPSFFWLKTGYFSSSRAAITV